MMKSNHPFYHEKTLAESNLYQKSLQEDLFKDLRPEHSDWNVSWDTEIVPEVTRDDHADQTATRLIIVDTATKTAREAYDPDRLLSKLDVDKVLEKFVDVDLTDIFTYLVFDLYNTMGSVNRPIDQSSAVIDTVDVDLLAALIAIGFHDPYDILFYLSTDVDRKTNSEMKFCAVVKVKPRLKN